MEKQIGYGEMVFKKQFDVKLKDGSTERRNVSRKGITRSRSEAPLLQFIE